MARASAADVDTRASTAVARASIIVEQARHAATAVLEVRATTIERATVATTEARATTVAAAAALGASAVAVEKATTVATEARASGSYAAYTACNCHSGAISKRYKRHLGASFDHSSSPVPPTAATSSLGAKIGLAPLTIEVTLTQVG
jgi:hypothetical protein